MGETQSRRRRRAPETAQKEIVSRNSSAAPTKPLTRTAPAAASPKPASHRGKPARREAETKASRPSATKAVNATSTTTLWALTAKRYVVARTIAARSEARFEKRIPAIAAAASKVIAEKRIDGRRVDHRVAPWPSRIEEATDA